MRRWQRSIMLTKGGHCVGDWNIVFMDCQMYFVNIYLRRKDILLILFRNCVALPAKTNRGVLRHEQRLRKAARNDNSAWEIGVNGLFESYFTLASNNFLCASVLNRGNHGDGTTICRFLTFILGKWRRTSRWHNLKCWFPNSVSILFVSRCWK